MPAVPPTAWGVRVDEAPRRQGRCLRGIGLVTHFHTLPFHRRIKILPLEQLAQPTAPGTAGGNDGHAKAVTGW